jgi:hypothetical protein
MLQRTAAQLAFGRFGRICSRLLQPTVRFRRWSLSWDVRRAIVVLHKFLTITLACILAASATASETTLTQISDAPDPQHARPVSVNLPATYASALQLWRTPENINAWIAARFEYDTERALILSETARAAGTRVEVHPPENFFATPRGVCVDLVHFGVSTLRRVQPHAKASYLMIEFEPVQVAGQTLRRHWLASYERDGAFYFFADSKRPGLIAGPYATVEQFIAEYAEYRRKPIVTHRILDSYERRMRTQAPKVTRE